MKAVAYLRVSTQEQSLDRQYDDIRKFAENKGLNLVNIFEDKLSGSKIKADDRKGFIEMEEYLEVNNDIKDILVLEISRLGRRTNDVMNVVQKYIDKGINIHIKNLDLTTLEKDGTRSAKAGVMISVFGAMAQNEAELMGERISSGKMSKARRNLAFGGKIIGYKKGEDGTPIIDKEQAPIIKRIFELSSQGLGMRNVSTMIESEFDKKIAIGTLSGIIRNTFHKGDRKYNNLILEVPAIVSTELWQKANDSIDSRKKFGSRTKVNTNIIQGKITCGRCRSVMHQKVIPQGRIDSFVCKNEKCKNSINRPWLFRMVRKAVERHAQKTKDEQVREKFKLQISSLKAQLGVNSKQLNKLKKARVSLTINHHMDKDILPVDIYNSSIEKIKQDLEKINKENIKLNEGIRNSENALKLDIEHFSQDLELFKAEIQDIINHVTIGKDRVLINIFGWREYDLYKPNSIKLGWEARKPEKERYLNEELPLRHPIDDENLEMMINNALLDYDDNI